MNGFMNDVDGMKSSKRLVTMMSFGVMVITWLLNLVFNISVSDYIFDGFMWLTAAGLGTVVAEKFIKRANKDK